MWSPLHHTVEDMLAKEKKVPPSWHCDQCSLFYLSSEKLMEHKRKAHSLDSQVKCRYCKKTLSITEESKECFNNRKCETCEYRCSQCPQRFLRHSSLMNHENNHSKQKKRKSSTPKSVIKSPIQNTSLRESNDNTKIALHKAEDEMLDNIVDSSFPTKRKRKLSSSPRKWLKLESPVIKTDLNVMKEHSIKLSKEGKSPRLANKFKDKSHRKQNVKRLASAAVNSTSSSEVNSVNYKPFSCHICNDSFASDGVLLEHIKTHGDAAQNLKCTCCDEQFDTIYDLQYHLAICPLAEDELESTLKNSIPSQFLPKLPKSLSTTNPSPRPRGRPRKVQTSVVNTEVETSNLDTEPSNTTRKKRNTTSKPLNKIPKVTASSLLNENSKLPINGNDLKDEIAEMESDETKNGLSNDYDQFDESFKSGAEDNKKLNICPFPRCGMKFTREKALECHMRNHSDDFDDTLKCHKCDIPFDDIKSLRAHVDECQGINEEVDDDDDDDFNGPKKYKTDRLNISSPRFTRYSEDFQCKTCGRRYLTMDKLKRHMAQHGSSDFLCRICKDVFVSQAFLDQHFLDTHPTKSPHHCSICNEDFISELFLQIHNTEYHDMPAIQNKQDSAKSLKIEPGTSSKSYNNTCFLQQKLQERKLVASSKTFNNSGYLQEKVITLFETVDNPFWCPVCLESYDQRQNLRAHFLSNHIVCLNSKYICEICDVEKTSAETLCWHLEVHSNNKLSVNRFSKLRTQSTSVMERGTESSPKLMPNFQNEMSSKNNQSKLVHVKIEDTSTQTVESNCNKISSRNKTKSPRLLFKFKRRKGLKSKVMPKLRIRSKRLSSKTSTEQSCSSVISELKEECNKMLNDNKTIKKYMKGKPENFKPKAKAENVFISNEDSKDYVRDCKKSSVTESLLTEPCRSDFLMEAPPNRIISESGTIKNQDNYRLHRTRSQSKAIQQLVSTSDTCNKLECIRLLRIPSEKNSENIPHEKESYTCVSTHNLPQEVNVSKNDNIVMSVSKVPPKKLKKSYIINTRKSKQTLINIESSKSLDYGKVDSVHDILENQVNDEMSTAGMVDKSLRYTVNISNESSLNEEAFKDTASSDSSVVKNNVVVGQISQDISLRSGQNQEVGSEIVQHEDVDSNKSRTSSNLFLKRLTKNNENPVKSEIVSSSERVTSNNYDCDSGISVSQSVTSKVVCEKLLKEIDCENAHLEKKQSSDRQSSNRSLTVSEQVLFREKEQNSAVQTHKAIKSTEKLKDATEKFDCETDSRAARSNFEESTEESFTPTTKRETFLNIINSREDLKDTKSNERLSPVENTRCETHSIVTRTTPTIREESLLGDKKKDSPKCENINLREDQKCTATDVTFSSAEHFGKADFPGPRSTLDASGEESKSPCNESFEEIPCDKCPLKFYNQDDLFDHIATHYDFN